MAWDDVDWADEEEVAGGGFVPVVPFWIDTDAYTDRDREMFVCGYEFCQLAEHIRHNDDGLNKTIHRENESRVRMLCGKYGRRCQIKPCKVKDDPDVMWSFLAIGPREGE